MPELPEVETTVRGLETVLQDDRLVAVTARRPDLRRPMPVDLRQRLTGATITGLDRRAKFGLIHTDRDDTLIFHLGMSGRWRIDPAELEKHDHLVLDTAAGRRAVLNDPRRFGSVDLVATPELSEAQLATVFAGRQAPVKALLLDQRVVAGLGNIYVCEALHLARIAPGTQGRRIGKDRLARLVAGVREIIAAAIEAGGSSLRDYARPDGELGYFSSQWRAYGREGEACTCGGVIRRRVDGGRSTFFCPRCQH
jgi:formamidopyrimidine-DNA glycosylase